MRFKEDLERSNQFGKPSQGIDPGKALDGFGLFLIFRSNKMFKALVMG